jgi:hypothetical protein
LRRVASGLMIDSVRSMAITTSRTRTSVISSARASRNRAVSAHALVWGVANYESLAVEGAEWTDLGWIRDEPYCAVSVDGSPTLFARTYHPS